MLRASVEWTYVGANILDGLKLWYKNAPRTLSDAVEEFCQRKPTSAHRALGDALDAVDIVEAQLQRWNHLPRDIRALHNLCFNDGTRIDPEGKFIWVLDKPCINFGKYGSKNTPMESIPAGYYQFILDGSFSPEVRQLAQDALKGKYPVKVG
jgi:hypothetical protein